MNYRHAFHAGNHLDVFKHAALSLVLEQLVEKPQPLAVLDTHAGVGVYDLQEARAQRTGEAAEGVGRLLRRPLVSAPSYARMVEELNPDALQFYPGSPEIALRLMRASDRLIACELHPDDAAELKRRYRDHPRAQIHARDGYEAIGALLPPKERRGLVLIDPPFESRDEPYRLEQALLLGLQKWPTGVFMGWYPVKEEPIGERLAASARREGLPKALRAEFLAYAADEAQLRGGGLLICNAPWKLGARLEALCRELATILGAGHASWTLEQLTPA